MFTFLSSAVYSYSYAHSLRSFTCFAGPFLRRQCRPHFLRTFYTCLIHLTGYRLGFVIGDGKSVTYQPAAHIIREPGQGASESERLSERKRATQRAKASDSASESERLLSSAVYFYLRSSLTAFLYYFFGTSCSRDLIWFGLFMFERFILLTISFFIYSLDIHLLLSFFRSFAPPLPTAL